MSLKLDPDHKSFDKLLARKTSIASAVFSTTTRVESAVFRARTKDKINELLEAIKKEEAKV